MNNNSRDTLRQALTIIALLVVLTVNALANILPINGVTTGDLSDEFNSLFVPAGYVFSIWAVIYTGLIAYAIYQAAPSRKSHPILRKIAPWFVVSCIANSAWIFLWHYRQVGLSVIAMVVILIALMAIYLILGIGRTTVPRGEKLWVHNPFSIYLAWISVATIANITDFLIRLEWDQLGFEAALWSIAMIIVGTAVAMLVAWQRADAYYAAVVVWALIGIAVAQWNTLPVAIAAGVMALILALTLLASWPNKRRRTAISIG